MNRKKPIQSSCFLMTATGQHRLMLTVADGFLTRLRGLMFRPPLAVNHGFLLTRCTSIHTCFMRDAIDVVYLDRDGVVTRCVPYLEPWRASRARQVSAARSTTTAPNPARHVLEMRAGSIRQLEIRPGCRIDHTAVSGTGPNRLSTRPGTPGRGSSGRSRHQVGSAMIEFAVVAPIMTLLGLASMQYGLLFFAKNNYNHAAFMAARAGSTGHASIDKIQEAYSRALIPLYGGGTDADELARSYDAATNDVLDNANIEILNPTAESFADFNDEDLQQMLGAPPGSTAPAKRVIPNGGLAYRNAAIVPAASGQNIQDANLLKLRITHAYKPQVPVVGAMYTRYLKWLDPGDNEFNTKRIGLGRIPVVMHVTLHMQSDAIEGKTVSTLGSGNGGTATNPGTPPAVPRKAPECESMLCTDYPPGPPGTGGSSQAGGAGTGSGGGNGQGGGNGGGSAPPGVCVANVTPVS